MTAILPFLKYASKINMKLIQIKIKCYSDLSNMHLSQQNTMVTNAKTSICSHNTTFTCMSCYLIYQRIRELITISTNDMNNQRVFSFARFYLKRKKRASKKPITGILYSIQFDFPVSILIGGLLKPTA